MGMLLANRYRKAVDVVAADTSEETEDVSKAEDPEELQDSSEEQPKKIRKPKTE